MIVSQALLMPSSRDSPPRTVRRRSLGGSVRSNNVVPAVANPQLTQRDDVTQSGSDAISEMVPKLKGKFLRQLGRILESFKQQIAGADDPDYPRSDVIQHMKQSAASIYTASRMICDDVCDVPDDAVLILYFFGVGTEMLFRFAADIVQDGRDDVEEGIMAREILGDARRIGSSAVTFKESDVDSYINRWVKRWELEPRQAAEVPQQEHARVRTPSPVRQRSPGRASPVIVRPRASLSKSPVDAFAAMPQMPKEGIDKRIQQAIHLLGGSLGDKKTLKKAETALASLVVEIREALDEAQWLRQNQRFSQEDTQIN